MPETAASFKVANSVGVGLEDCTVSLDPYGELQCKVRADYVNYGRYESAGTCEVKTPFHCWDWTELG